ncbi:MAG: molecular chaperone TorD family protein [Planctomycetes bacterium]|nr:molecular chaperone TorD family protein [Planctomycetota bacterium]
MGAPVAVAGAQDTVDRVRARSGVLAFLAQALRYPTPGLLEELRSGPARAGLDASVTALDPASTTALEAARYAVARALTEAGPHGMLEAYVHTFGHSVRSTFPPYELEYGGVESDDVPRELGALVGFYRAWGLQPSLRAGDRPDHVAAECEFAHYLAWREAEARARDGEGRFAEVREARRRFLGEHLGRWAPALGRKLAGGARAPYDALGTLLAEAVRDECASLGVEGGPPTLPLRPLEGAWEVAPMSCGGCPARGGAPAPEGPEDP